MKKLFQFTFIILLAFFFQSCMSSCNNTPDPDSSKKEGWYDGKIKVGHLVALDMAPLFVAKEAGFFKEEGLDLETVFFSNPGDNNASLAGGSIQFSTNPFTLPYFAENSGVPMRIISTAGGIGIIQVIIHGKYNIETVEDLVKWIKANPDKKLKIGVLKGDTLEMIVYKMLKDNGLTYEDVEMVWFNDLLAMVQTFQTKQIDVLSHIKPYTTNLIVNEGAKVLTDNSKIWGYGTPNCTVSIMEEFGKKYPETVKAYLRAIKKGFELVVNNPERAAELLDGGNYYKVEKDVLLYAFKTQPKEVILKPDIEGMMIAISDLFNAGYIKKPEKNIVDTKFLDAIGSK